MSELPGRPDLDQLRRQARELLRAAAADDPAALARIRAVSQGVSLSAAQLALAREYGFTSWPALHAEAARRRSELLFPGLGGTRWSFGGAAAIETPAGMLYPGGLVAGPAQAALHASLMPIAETRPRPAAPGREDNARRAWTSALSTLAQAASASVALTDDRGTVYTLRLSRMSANPERQDHAPELVSLRLTVDPVPAPERGWLELRGPSGPAARLLPSPRPPTRVSGPGPVPGSPTRRELSKQALEITGLRLRGADPEDLERECAAALSRAAEIQQSAEPAAAGDLPARLTRLCAALTGHGPASGLSRGWSGMLDAAGRTDGASLHLDVSAALPRVDGTEVRVDSIVSEPEIWRVYLRAEPGWWIYSDDSRQHWSGMSVTAEDDLGGLYVSWYDGGDHEDLILRFLPRLNPLARALTLTFSGICEQVSIKVHLP